MNQNQHSDGSEQRSIVYVGGIIKGASKEVLQELFGALKGFKALRVEKHIQNNNGKPYALVEFDSGESASKAIRLLNKEGLEGNKQKIVISFFDAKIVCTTLRTSIGELKQYKDFIKELREKLADHSCGDKEEVASGSLSRPVLPKQQCEKQPDRWIHIMLSLKSREGREESTTTLVMRDDNLYVKGFTGKGGKWFELCGRDETEEEMLPEEYGATRLEGWDLTYSGIMGLKDMHQADKTLESMRLGKDLAVRAVRRLSRYPDAYNNDKNPMRLGLAGLIVMVCEAARMVPFLDHFAQGGGDAIAGWNTGKGLTPQLIDFSHNWKNLSAGLLKWRDGGDKEWNSICGLPTGEHGLKCVYLVLNSHRIKHHGRAKVEILGLRASANLSVRTVEVKDEAHASHRIYTNDDTSPTRFLDDDDLWGDDQEDKELELTVRDTSSGKGISASAWFDIKVNLAYPDPHHDPDDDRIISITRRWYCRRKPGATGEDSSSSGCTERTLKRTIRFDNPSGKMDVTYLVMSNAVESTVEVSLRLPLGRLPLAQENAGDSASVHGTSVVSKNTRSCSSELQRRTRNPSPVNL